MQATAVKMRFCGVECTWWKKLEKILEAEFPFSLNVEVDLLVKALQRDCDVTIVEVFL